MNELKIIANNTTPAKVDFNYKEIEEQLNKVLVKYTGLMFTDETVKNCKKSIADLREGQQSLDDFRKDTKKILTESVTEFENECKELYKKFEKTIDPLKEQTDHFERLRKEENKDLCTCFSDAETKIIDEFFDILRGNRKHGKTAESVLRLEHIKQQINLF